MPTELVVGEHDSVQAAPCIRFGGLANGFQLRGIGAYPLMRETGVQPARAARRRRVAIIEQCKHSAALICRHAYRQLLTAVNRRSSSPYRTSSCFAGCAARRLPPKLFRT